MIFTNRILKIKLFVILQFLARANDLLCWYKNNPDKTKQKNPILGLDLLKGFVFDDDEWEDALRDDEYQPQPRRPAVSPSALGELLLRNDVID